MKHSKFVRWVNYQKTLLAVYWLSEPDGIRCYASTVELAAETDLSAPTIRRQLARLKKNGITLRAPVPDRPEGRALVLLDHPDAVRYLKSNMDYWGPLSRQAELNRERQRATTTKSSSEALEACPEPGEGKA